MCPVVLGGRVGERTEPEHGSHRRNPLLTLRATLYTGKGRRPRGPRAPGTLQTLLCLRRPWQPGLGRPGPREPVSTALLPEPHGAASPPGQHVGGWPWLSVGRPLSHSLLGPYGSLLRRPALPFRGPSAVSPPMTEGSMRPTEGPSCSMELWGLERGMPMAPRTSLT